MAKTEVSGNIGPYEVRRLLGQGGMGSVYLAADPALDRMVAVKLLPLQLADEPQIVERFQREARALAKLRHPNLMHIYTVGEHEGRPYFAMEYVKGSTLSSLIAKIGHIPAPQVARVAAEVLSALDKVHQAEIVHRDIKSGNIMIDEDGRAVLMDFGLARQEQESRLTADYTILGTPNYMSPEQASGEPVDARTDIYSLGIVLYEMLTGAPPFTGKTSFEILRQHIESSVPPPSEIRPDVPEAFDAVVARAVAKSPEDRYQDVRQMAADLAKVCSSETLARLGGAPGVGTEPTVLLSQHGAPFESTVQPKGAAGCASASSGRSHRWLWGGLAALWVLIGLFVWHVIGPGPESPPVQAPEPPPAQVRVGQVVEMLRVGAEPVRGRLISIEVLDDGTTTAKIRSEGSGRERTVSIQDGDELRVVRER